MTQDSSGRKAKFEEQADAALKGAMKLVGQARAKAGELTHDNRSKIDQAMDKVGRLVDEKTGGKYHDTVEKVKAQAAKGVDFVEKERGSGPPQAHTGPADSASGTTPPMASPIPPYTPPAGAPAGTTPPPADDQPPAAG